jgi:hypothetical protein
MGMGGGWNCHDCVEWLASVLTVLNIQILLPESYLITQAMP